jgi:hypothetical protein
LAEQYKYDPCTEGHKLVLGVAFGGNQPVPLPTLLL